jgi:large subunit ribosomal protein L4
MIKLEVLNEQGEPTGNNVELPDSVFGIEPNPTLVHQLVVTFLANQRQGNAAAKTRSEVNGGGRKPWRQKGTGRARHGTIRSPLWRGGGVTHGPQQRSYTKKVNKKMKNLAIRSVLSDKTKSGDITCVEKVKFEKPKTSRINQLLKNIGLQGHKIIWITDEYIPEMVLSARNVKNVEVFMANSINTYDLLNADKVIVSPESVKVIKEVFEK